MRRAQQITLFWRKHIDPVRNPPKVFLGPADAEKSRREQPKGKRTMTQRKVQLKVISLPLRSLLGRGRALRGRAGTRRCGRSSTARPQQHPTSSTSTRRRGSSRAHSTSSATGRRQGRPRAVRDQAPGAGDLQGGGRSRRDAFFVINRWLGGTLTSFRTIRSGASTACASSSA